MKKDTPSKIDNIQFLYDEIDNKIDFMNALSPVCGRKPASLRNNWFGGFWSIPDKEQDDVIVFMQNYIKQQNLKKQMV